MKRRQLLQAVGLGWLAEQVAPDERPIQGKILGADHRVGHLLRSAQSLSPVSSERATVVIVGSGASGSSAAWRLAAEGVEVLQLELEPFAGGTSSWGDDGAVAHPWGAHYLPVPEKEARTTQRLLVENGVIHGWDLAGRPLLRDDMLCHAPEERLRYADRWHGGLIPYDALNSFERAEVDRFRALQDQWLNALGSDGRPAFSLPFETSSRDASFLQLDKLTMAQWLQREGFHSRFMHWYVEYATLDDFGANLDDVSAWAGLHYFAARRMNSQQTEGSRYLVWPEGNGWLVRRMLAKLQGERRHQALVLALQRGSHGGIELHYLDVIRNELRRVDAQAVILATPAFINQRLLRGDLAGGARLLPQRVTSPWLVANLHVHRRADPNAAWDTMHYNGAGLGYVNANHQLVDLHDDTVLTYFRAYGHADAAGTRAKLLGQSWSELASEVLADLVAAEPDLAAACSRLDIKIWGHAMPRPRPGFLGETPFTAPLQLAPEVFWAHVDQTGFALFEEANLRGVRAAEAVLKRLGKPVSETWT